MSPLWILITLLPILGGAQRFNCKGRILGAYYADAKSGCKAFHVCVRVAGGGIRDFRFFCPPGTLFHQEAQTCTDWGDDDPLACPADLYDGQFDLYKIGSGYDTKKLSATGNREEEVEFGLQRAETGDRRLSQNSAANAASNDLRAAHSSDFFSGQRDRGRDEPAQAPPAQPSPRPPQPRPAQHRQSFRRATTPRPAPTTTQYTTPAPSPQPQPTSPQQYEVSKRKLVRKRPIYVSTPAPQKTFPPNTPPQPTYQEQPQQNFNRRYPQQTKTLPTTTPDVPPQYREFKDEYVEVSRVTPKPKPNRYYPNNPTPLPASHATLSSQNNKKSGLVEIYNLESQSTPGFNLNQNDRPFKVQNNFNVAEVPREEFARTRSLNNRPAPTTTVDYNTPARATSTPSYKNYNSVSYEQDKNNFIPYSKQNYNNNPTTAPTTTTTFYTTTRQDLTQNLNTVAYNTNNGFHSQSNFANPDEDDGQYHPPEGEDDGQYKPELYEGELLSGAHSLNIAASGNRLPEDQKSYSKTKASKPIGQTSAPRPFRPAQTPSSASPQSTRAPEYSYTTTVAPQTQRTFDLFQTYTTTSRPSDLPGDQDFVAINNAPLNRPTTTVAPRVVETRPPRPHTYPPHAPTFPPSPAPKPTTRVPNISHPVNNKEDTSYDYAYYDSDTGFSEYDHIEEFGRTKKRT